MDPVSGPEGFTVPRSAHFESSDGRDSEYSVQSTIEHMIAFYDRQDLQIKRNPRGATVRSPEGHYLLQIIKGSAGTVRLQFLWLSREG